MGAPCLLVFQFSNPPKSVLATRDALWQVNEPRAAQKRLVDTASPVRTIACVRSLCVCDVCLASGSWPVSPARGRWLAYTGARACRPIHRMRRRGH